MCRLPPATSATLSLGLGRWWALHQQPPQFVHTGYTTGTSGDEGASSGGWGGQEEAEARSQPLLSPQPPATPDTPGVPSSSHPDSQRFAWLLRAALWAWGGVCKSGKARRAAGVAACSTIGQARSERQAAGVLLAWHGLTEQMVQARGCASKLANQADLRLSRMVLVGWVAWMVQHRQWAASLARAVQLISRVRVRMVRGLMHACTL